MIRRLLIALVLDGPALGPLAPRLLGLALGRRPRLLASAWEFARNRDVGGLPAEIVIEQPGGTDGCAHIEVVPG